MGFSKSKTHHRDEISGLHVHDDVQDGSHSVNELNARAAARQQGLNDAIRADWPKDMTSTKADIEDAAYGNVGSRVPRPTDVSSKGDDRFGVSETPGKQVPKKAPRPDSKVSR